VGIKKVVKLISLVALVIASLVAALRVKTRRRVKLPTDLKTQFSDCPSRTRTFHDSLTHFLGLTSPARRTGRGVLSQCSNATASARTRLPQDADAVDTHRGGRHEARAAGKCVASAGLIHVAIVELPQRRKIGTDPVREAAAGQRAVRAAAADEVVLAAVDATGNEPAAGAATW
jgi:hypothetical protein